jgi:hypothetical protein
MATLRWYFVYLGSSTLRLKDAMDSEYGSYGLPLDASTPPHYPCLPSSPSQFPFKAKALTSRKPEIAPYEYDISDMIY